MHPLESFFNLTFSNNALLDTALTHASYAYERGVDSNERLEFLGDAVIDVVVAEYLYNTRQEAHEGELTKDRAKHVCEAALVDYAHACGLAKHIKLGHGEEKAGGRKRNALLADAFEAFVGAVFLDQGLSAVELIAKKVIYPFIEEERISEFVDYKSKLQELVQSDKRSLQYKIVSESGPSHDKTFVTRVFMDQIVMGEGTGRSKKDAEQHAAKAALEKMTYENATFEE